MTHPTYDIEIDVANKEAKTERTKLGKVSGVTRTMKEERRNKRT
jgi:hypothetical protein